VHWHGFPNAISFFDGEPNASLAVPVARTFEYFYRPVREGTYLYHCHFEDTEHITMGMTSVVFVRPAGGANYAYNDPASNADPALRTPDPSTQFDRQFVMFMSDMDTTEHDNLRDVQENDFSDFSANYFLLNGRAYPDTLLPNGDPTLPLQRMSSLITCNTGERVLLRFASLSFNIHAIQSPGIPLRVIGKDARLLRGRNGEDQSYLTHTVYIGPGETTDVIFTAPSVTTQTTYRLGSRNFDQLSNDGVPGAGGMQTEIRVYPAGTLGPQVGLNG
jgi:FtsP/CotA-like multicopper oxidase with cupredoxin domain